MISDIGATCNICIHKFSQDGTVFETFRVLAFLELGSVFSPLGIKILVYLGQCIRTERHTTVGRWIGSRRSLPSMGTEYPFNISFRGEYDILGGLLNFDSVKVIEKTKILQ